MCHSPAGEEVELDSMSKEEPSSQPQPPELKRGLRLYVGIASMVLAFILPVFVIVVPYLGLSNGGTLLISAGLFVGGPEILTLVAVALLGKETLRYFTYRIKKALRSAIMERPVSRARYYFGLVLFLGSILPHYIYGYFPAFLPEDKRMYMLATGDLAFLISVFIMGGEFWEKIQKIFIWEGKR